MGVDGLVGLSPIEMARQALGIYSAHEEYQGRFYANNAAPGGYITIPQGKTLDAEGVQQLKANWNGAHRGLPAAGKIGVLQDGQEFTQSRSR
jgi:phage portal protein BeeE